MTAYLTKAEKSHLQANCGALGLVDLYEVRSRSPLGNHLIEISATIQFVNARLPSKCSRMLKKFSDLKRLNENDPNSEDVFVPTLIEDHYPTRPKRLGHMCLYDSVRHIDETKTMKKLKQT